MLKILWYIIVGWIIFSVLSTEFGVNLLFYAIIGIIFVFVMKLIKDELKI